MAAHSQVHSHLLLAISMLALKGSNSVIKKKRLFWKGENNPRISVAPNSTVSLFSLRIIRLTAPTWHIQKLNKRYSNKKSYIKPEINGNILLCNSLSAGFQ